MLWLGSPDSSALLRNLMENAAIAIAFAGPDGRIGYANPAFSDMLGYQPGESVALAVDDIMPRDALDDVRDQLRQLAVGEIEVCRAERLCPRKDGGAFWARMSVSMVRDDRTGRPLHLVVQLEDIDRQKLAEAALGKNEQRMNYALESAGQGVWDYDLNTKQMFYSRMWRLMRGFDPDEEVDSALDVWLARVHPEDRERIREIVRRQDSGELSYNAFEYRERHRDGRWIWILSRGKPVEWNPDRSPARIIGTDTDITKLKEEEALRRKNELAYDKNLIYTYTKEQDLIDTLDRHISTLEGLIKVSEFKANNLKTKLAELTSMAEMRKREGGSPRDDIRQNIDILQRQIAEEAQSIQSRRDQQQVLRDKFTRDLQRYRELKGLETTPSPPITK